MATACITGASSGIGMEFAKQLAAKGYNLILIARNTKALETLAQKLPCKCKIIFCDLSKEAQCTQLAERLKKYNIHILINNAGFGDLSSFHSADLGKSLDMINVNIKALHIFTRKLLPVFIKKNRGCILNVASSAGLLPGGPYMSSYYATKAYVTSLTYAIYQELKDLNSKVHISMLCPGPVDTNFNNQANVSFSLPGISASYCVSYTLKQMSRGKLIIIPGLTMKLAVGACRVTPRKLVLPITAHQQKKKSV